MTVATPTTTETADQIVAAVESKLGHSLPILAKAFTRVVAWALAGAYVLIYKYAAWMSLQLFVRTASARETEILGQTITPLKAWGDLVGEPERTPATRAELEVTLTVLSTGGAFGKHAQLVRSATGVVYLNLVGVALTAPSVTVQVRASSDQDGGGGAGTIGNLQVGDELQLASPPANVSPTAVVSSVLVTGADAESVEDYRGRVQDRFRARPQGGAFADYRAWASGVAGIVAAYPYKGEPGKVDVYVEATVASSGSADGIPTGAQLLSVYDAIQLDDDGLASRRQVSAAVTVRAITRTAFDVTVNGLDVADVPAAEAAIEAAVDEYLRARAPFIVGLSVLPRRDRVTRAAVAGVVDDVASALGATVASVDLEKDSAITPAYTLGEGEKAKLGTISFV